MTTIRQRLAATIDPQPAETIAALTNDLSESAQQVGILRDSLATFYYVLQEEMVSVASPHKMATNLQEAGFDQALLDQMLDQLGWDTIVALGAGGEDAGRQRQHAVEQAIRLFRYSPLAQWAIWLWTGWGLGDKITVTLKKPQAQEVWDEFAVAERNEAVLSEDTIHELSDWLQVKGNRFLALFTATEGTNKGQSYVRVLDQAQIKPVPNPADKLDTWFYKRSFVVGTDQREIYYPDHRTLLGKNVMGEPLLEERWAKLIELKVVRTDAKRADLLQDNTAVSVLHIAHNRKEETSVWGWPVTTASGAWVKGQKQYAEARLGVAMAVAQYVRRSRIKGGSRAVQTFAAQIQSTLSQSNYLDGNPPGAAGSWHVENEASTTKELPLRTGAGDAKDDNELFSWMALLGMGLFPTSAGLDTSRWATAIEMDKAQAMLFERYQRFWAAQFRKLVRLVLMLADRYGPATFSDEDTKAKISTDSFSLSDYPDVSEAVADQVKKMLEPYVGIIPEDTVKAILSILWTTSMEALGLDTTDLTSEKAFGVGMEPKPVPMPPPPGDEEEPEEEPEEESAFIGPLQVALQNLAAGDITADQFAEFGLALIGEVYSEQGEKETKAALGV